MGMAGERSLPTKAPAAEEAPKLVEESNEFFVTSIRCKGKGEAQRHVTS